MQSTATPTIGLIVAPASGRIPPDGTVLYGEDRVRFIAEGLGVAEISPSAFDDIVDQIIVKALLLRDAGAQAITLMGTSLSFYRGAAFTDDLRDRMAEVTGLPCTTASHGIIDSLHELNVTRVAVATSYIDDLNEKLAAFLESHSFTVTQVNGLSITGVDAMREVSAASLTALSEQTVRDDPSANGLLISCSGLRTLGLHEPLEKSLGMPVISSGPAGYWQALRVARLPTASPGFGRLFAR